MNRTLFVMLVASCDGAHSTARVDADIALPDAAMLRTVSGTANARFVSSAGDTILPLDLRQLSIQVIVPPMFTALPVQTSANGTFTADNVPEGTFYLQLGHYYIVMSSDTVDLSFDVSGRPANSFATNPTDLTFDVTGLAGWQTGDEIEMYSPGSGTVAYAMQDSANTGAPVANDTALSGLVYDLSRADDPALIDGSEGDQLAITQMTIQTDGTRTYQTIANTYTPSSFTVANGGTATISGAFTPQAQSSTLNVLWDRPAFAAELNAHASTGAPQNWSTLAITALPEAATRGFYAEGPDVVIFAPGYLTDSTAVNATWQYADPYPSSWTRIAWCRYYRYRFIQLAGASPVAIFSHLLSYRDLSTVTAQAPLEPLVGVPENPLVNGNDASGTSLVSGVGTTPTLSWSSPSMGTAARYYVFVYLVQAVSGATTLQTIASLETPATHLMIPSGIMAPGKTYAFEIVARAVTGVDLAATPSVYSLPEGRGSITTTMVTP